MTSYAWPMVRDVRLVLVFSALVASAACGAQSEKHESGEGDGNAGAGDAGDAGESGGGSAGTSGGGTSGGGSAGRASGGTGGVAGGMLGGTGGVSGSGAGAGGFAGSGGMMTDYSKLPTCLQPINGGTCMAAFPRYGFDVNELRCVQFVYGGCNPNDNNFETLEACEAECGTAYPDCDAEPRPVGCPCTSMTACDGRCSNAFYEFTEPEVSSCPPSLVGLCKYINEASCVCPLDGGFAACGA